MYKLSIPTLSKFKVTRTWLYVLAGVLVFSAIVAFGIVQSVQAEREATVAQAVAEERKKSEAQAVYNRITALEATLQAERADSKAICSWVKGVAPKYRFTVPPLCQVR